jgi:hypothetical protein
LKNDLNLLIQNLQSQDIDARRGAARGLGELGDSRAVEPLIHALGDKDPIVKLKAAEGLGSLKDKKGVRALIELLADDDKDMRRVAKWSLKEIGGPQVTKGLVKALVEDQDVRWEAANALGDLEDIRAVKILVEVLGHENLNVRRHAERALVSIGYPVRSYLENLANEKGFREIAQNLLEKICPFDAKRRLTGIQIFHLLPKTNCGECELPTCLAFAMAVASGNVDIGDCNFIPEEIKNKVSVVYSFFSEKERTSWDQQLIGKTINEHRLENDYHWHKLTEEIFWASFPTFAGHDFHSIHIFIFIKITQLKIKNITFNLIKDGNTADFAELKKISKQGLKQLYESSMPPTIDLQDDVTRLIELILED